MRNRRLHLNGATDISRHFYLIEPVEGGVHGGEIPLDNGLSTLAVSRFYRGFYSFYGLVPG